MSQAVLGDRYRLGERIAGGGMGSVYRAVDESLGRQVAVKVLRRELAAEPAYLERFRREARASAALSHPGVAGVYDCGELGGSAFIVMELVEGEILADRIAARGRLPWPEAFAIGEQVARALAAAHASGLVHRDIKPGNVLVDTAGRAKVTDFGIAKAAAAAPLTRTGMVVGSANYVAPEQAQGDDVGPPADLYSLGCVLFEAVTSRPPYRGASAVTIAAQHVSAPVPDPRRHRPDLPVAAGELIRRALAKPPEDRFASAAAMADALAAAEDALGAPHPNRPGAPHPSPPGACHPNPPGAPHPNPPDAGAPAREGSPGGEGAAAAVHSPAPRRPGWRWRRSS